MFKNVHMSLSLLSCWCILVCSNHLFFYKEGILSSLLMQWNQKDKADVSSNLNKPCKVHKEEEEEGKGHNETQYVCTKMLNKTNMKLTLSIKKTSIFNITGAHFVPCFGAFVGKTKTWINAFVCTTFSLSSSKDFHSVVHCGSWKQSCTSCP